MFGFNKFLHTFAVGTGIIALLLAGSALAESQLVLKDISYETYESESRLFTVLLPKGWGKKERDFSHAYTQTGDKVYGVEISPEYQFDEVSPTISILFYEYGQFFKDYEHFIKLKSASFTRISPEQSVPVETINVSGRVAKQFEIEIFQLVMLPFDPPAFKEGVVYEIAPPSRKVILTEKHVVIPAANGFYVLSYRSSSSITSSVEVIFENILDSFEPAIK